MAGRTICHAAYECLIQIKHPHREELSFFCQAATFELLGVFCGHCGDAASATSIIPVGAALGLSAWGAEELMLQTCMLSPFIQDSFAGGRD